MVVAAARAADGDGGSGSGGGAQLQRSLERFEGVDWGDLGRVALHGLATLQLAIWRRGAREEQGYMREGLRYPGPGRPFGLAAVRLHPWCRGRGRGRRAAYGRRHNRQAAVTPRER